MKIKYLFILFILIVFYTKVKAQTTCVTNPGASWTVPAGVTTATVYCWGGGGGGGGSVSGSEFADGGGGGGGACAISVLTVNAGDVYTLTQGAGGTAGSTAGGNGGTGGTTTATGPGGTVSANGGAGGIGSTGGGGTHAGGAGSGTGTGTTVYTGGSGSAGNDGTSSTTGITGTGGGGAGSGSNGTTPASACGVTGTGGTGTYSGGNGGYNTDCNTTTDNAGVNGSAPGGGGSGANSWLSNLKGGVGGAGQIVICYISSAPVTTCTTITSTGTWVVPAGVTTCSVYVWGAGGGSGGILPKPSGLGNGSGGGGGGACTVNNAFAVTATNTYNITIGAGGTAGTTAGTSGGTGGTTTFTGPGGTITANGGVGSAGITVDGTSGSGGAGATTGSGGTTYAGGNGSTGLTNSSSGEVGGGGGGGAGSGGAGSNGTAGVIASGTSSLGGAGGAGTYPGGAGSGNGETGTNLPGVNGNAPGGGAAGAANWSAKENGGVGGAGQVVICYSSCVSPTITVNAAPATQTVCQNTTPTNLSITIGGSGTFQWYSNVANSNSGGTTVGAANGGQTNTYTPPTTSAGTMYYYCVVSSACAANVTSVAVKVIVTAAPVVAAIGGGASTVCLSNPSAAFTDATAGGTWSETDGAGSATIDPATGVATGVTIGSATINYAVTSSGCTTTVTYAVTVSDVAFVNAIGGGAASVCVGNSTPAFTDATAGGTWSIINGTGSATINNATGVVTGVSAGAVTVNYAVTNTCGTVNVTYNLTITTGCSGTPTGGTAVATAVSGCGASYASTISLNGATVGCGISYQWYKSPDNATWTIIAGATSATYAATVSADTYYECILTCSNGGATGTSSSIFCAYNIANDNCAGATAMTFGPGINLGDYIATIQGDNTCATSDGSSSCFTEHKSVWFKFTAPVAGCYGSAVESGGTMRYPEMSIKTGTCAGFTEVCCAGVDNASGNFWQSAAVAGYTSINGFSPYSEDSKYYVMGGICNVTAGQTVYIMVDDYQTAGTFTLTVATLVNDAVPSGVVVASCGAAFNSSTIGATNCSNGVGDTYYNDLDGNTGTGCSSSGGSSCGNGSGSAGSTCYSAGTTGSNYNGGDVGYSVENDSWYQFCVTASTTVTVAFAPVASTCLPTTGHGGSGGLQIAIFTGAANNLTKVAGGYCGMGITGTYNSTFAMPTNQCCYVQVDGDAGTNCNYNLTVTMSPACVLPVEILSFSGVLTDDIRAKLNWVIATEVDVDYYLIERSTDGTDFTTIGTVKTKGNSTSQINYEMYDNNPAKGINYYRLSETDKNGKNYFLGYAVVKNKASLAMLNLYPNPAQNSVTFSLKNFAVPTANYELYSAQGILLKTESIDLNNGNQDYKIDLSGLSNGLYYIKVDAGDQLLKKTFVKSE